ncbi:heavy metal-responsive transcriptional regulator [Geothrix limicola]|uniref:Heavy metal-responsive transcriptional regulator n=1 Tax=Geothrix limicola TaxID=2927978 RepID=A0ABQ5QDY3_9BACT|nr:MerR family transcriptional regulator [Geothrix limicola]GLH73059.1 heavy metal-responsive transcriptional regulator [Geothrix limicola]
MAKQIEGLAKGSGPSGMLKIGQLADLSGVTARNLRFYADAGVFGELPRSGKGYRLFPAEAVHWVRMLRAAQVAGFDLEEIQELLRVLRGSTAPCGHVREALGTKLTALEVRLAEINALVELLRLTLATPDGQSSTVGCDLMATLLDGAGRLRPRESETLTSSRRHS